MTEESKKADRKEPPKLNKKMAKTIRRVSSTAKYNGIRLENRLRKDRRRRGKKG